MFDKIWKIKEKQETKPENIQAAGSKLLADLLELRGIDTPKRIKDFLNPSNMKISSPFVFTDMQKAVDRILSAIETQEKIIIYGDFDADGVTSASLLFKTLTHLGANVEYYIPNREDENHGLNTKALVKLISKQKAKLIITVDCGVSDVEQVNFANGFKVDVIITDHHEAPEILPNAYAILNPKAFNSLKKDLSVEEIEALNQLAGVGVAFKLACALLEVKKEKSSDFQTIVDFAEELLPLVAVGTIADIVPVLYENRAFVDAGLKLIRAGKNLGLTKLLEISGHDMNSEVSYEDIAFGAAPRINAAGRLDTVEHAVKLLISENRAEIDMCVEELNNLNHIRQDLCDRIYNEAIEMLQSEKNSETVQDSVILYNPEWHIGIIGIVASKLVNKFYRPVFLMTKDHNTGLTRCSARSIPEVHLRNAIAENESLMEYFGGHSQAAGLVFDPAKSKFETVKQALNNSIRNQLDGKDIKPCIEIDLEIDSKDLTIDLLDTLKRLEPFGEGNKSPLFLTKNLVLTQYRTMGANNNHLKIFCENADSKPFECVYWNHGELNIPQGKEFDIVYYPKLNFFNGITTLQLDIQDIKSQFLVKEKTSEPKLYDHRKKTNIFNQISDYLINTKVKTRVFAQNKSICENLKPYSGIWEITRSRKNIEKCEQLMFFDYPAGRIIMEDVIKKTGAASFHFMNYNNKKIDPQALIKNISGMLKYVDNNKDGNVNLCEISDFLSVTDEVTELCFDMFQDMGMIEVIQKSVSDYKIKFLHAVEFSKIKENEMYQELQNELERIYTYRQILCTMPLDEIISV